MSSLQKFHRRTMSLGPVTWPATVIGMGDITHGFWLGDVSSNKLVVAPKSTEVQLVWGSKGTTRGTVSTTNGLANTNTLYSFGNSITTGHPAAYYCKTLTQGGYNTWYLPAIDELTTMYSNKSAVPFVTANSLVGDYYWASTEGNYDLAGYVQMAGGYSGSNGNKGAPLNCRAVRRSTI